MAAQLSSWAAQLSEAAVSPAGNIPWTSVSLQLCECTATLVPQQPAIQRKWVQYNEYKWQKSTLRDPTGYSFMVTNERNSRRGIWVDSSNRQIFWLGEVYISKKKLVISSIRIFSVMLPKGVGYENQSYHCISHQIWRHVSIEPVSVHRKILLAKRFVFYVPRHGSD